MRYKDVSNIFSGRVLKSPWCCCDINYATEHDPTDVNSQLALSQTINPSFPVCRMAYHQRKRKSCDLVVCYIFQDRPFKMNAKLIGKMHFWSSQKSLVDIIAMYFREGKRKQNICHSKCHLAFERKKRLEQQGKTHPEQSNYFNFYWEKGSKTFLTSLVWWFQPSR